MQLIYAAKKANLFNYLFLLRNSLLLHHGDPLGRGAWVRLLRFTYRAADGPVPPEMTRSRPPRLDAVPGHREAAGDNSRGAS
jgi:hypothetical protein